MVTGQSTGVQARSTRRTRACKQCRTAKVRCSGARPCERCTRRRDACAFAADEIHVTVSEQYLRNLEQYARESTAITAATTATASIRRTSHLSASEPEPHPLQSYHDVSDSASTGRATASSSAAMPTLESCRVDGNGETCLVTDALGPRSHLSPNAASTSETAPASNVATQGILGQVRKQQVVPTVSAIDNAETPRNPLLAHESAYIRGSDGLRLLFLGHTSTWSFCRRAFMLLEDAVTSPDSSLAPLNLDGTAYRLRWQSKAHIDSADLHGLPPSDHTQFLFHAVKFHLGDLVGIIDEANFWRILNEFQRTPLVTAQSNVLWFVEYLMILAFGKAFTSYRGATTTALPGSDYAARALSILPNVAYLQEERPALQAIEVLSLIALYLQSVDMRSPAYQYIGQALRLSLHDGLHRKMSEELIGPDVADRCKTAWWTVYVLDEELTAGLGCPSMITQDSISTTLFDTSSATPSEIALTFRARIARVISNMSNNSYSSEQDSGSDFVRDTTLTLHRLAELARDIDAASSAFKAHGGEVPYTFYNVSISYNHCIVLATRPLAIWLLARSLQSRRIESNSLSTPIASLFEKAAQSSTITLMGLAQLVEREMLETFLPFQLEYAFSAAILLSLIGAILPEFISDPAWRRAALSVFDEMVKRGSVIAPMRKAEWKHLETLLQHHGRQPSLFTASETIESSTAQNTAEPQVYIQQNLNLDAYDQGEESGLGMFLGGAFDMSDLNMIEGDDIFALAKQFELGEVASASIFE